MSDKVRAAHRVLWLTVLHQTIGDYERGKASELYFQSGDFKLICALADVTPESVRKRLNL